MTTSLKELQAKQRQWNAEIENAVRNFRVPNNPLEFRKMAWECGSHLQNWQQKKVYGKLIRRYDTGDFSPYTKKKIMNAATEIIIEMKNSIK